MDESGAHIAGFEGTTGFDMKWGDGSRIQLTDNSLTLGYESADETYHLKIQSTLVISTITPTRKTAMVEVRYSTEGGAQITGTVLSLITIPLKIVDVVLVGATVSNRGVGVESATIKPGQGMAFGGTSATAYDVWFQAQEPYFSIGGGAFTLPGFTLGRTSAAVERAPGTGQGGHLASPAPANDMSPQAGLGIGIGETTAHFRSGEGDDGWLITATSTITFALPQGTSAAEVEITADPDSISFKVLSLELSAGPVKLGVQEMTGAEDGWFQAKSASLSYEGTGTGVSVTVYDIYLGVPTCGLPRSRL